jgi:hypothetical protein
MPVQSGEEYSIILPFSYLAVTASYQVLPSSYDIWYYFF